MQIYQYKLFCIKSYTSHINNLYNNIKGLKKFRKLCTDIGLKAPYCTVLYYLCISVP